jgi:P-type Cu+ transporter
MIPDIQSRLKKAAAISIPIVLVEMCRHLAGWPRLDHDALTIWQIVMAAGTTLVVFHAGWPLLVKGWLSFRRRKLNMFSLIAPGILITYAFSLLALCFPGLFPASFKYHGHAPVYFEAAAMITTLVLLGQFLEARAERKTGSALEALARLNPSRAVVIRNGLEQWIAIDDLKVGEIIQLRAGDRIPADGNITQGSGNVDESMITGEPLPVTRQSGNPVVAGTLVREGAMQMVAEKVGRDTVLSHIIKMVQDAQESRAPIQRIADRVTGKLVPAVMMIALLTFIGWWWKGPEPALWYALLHALTVLMITCPCALGLATPLSITTGLGRAAASGILIKDAASLETLSTVNTMVIDKTGTLTTGHPVLHACIPCEQGNETWLLKLAASVEHLSHHPLAAAIVEGARQWGITLDTAVAFQSESGLGVAGKVENHDVLVGQSVWLSEHGISDFTAFQQMADQYESEGRTVVWVAIDGKLAGLLVIADQLKANAVESIVRLKQLGLKLVILSGDSENTARMIGRQLNIENVISRVNPGEKAGHIKKLREQGNIVAMAGDGINDAPALATADVGIAVGTGTAVAVSSGQINLLHGNIIGLPQSIELSRAVMRNIRQNLFFAFAYNAIMIPVAAGALFPWTGWMLTPMLASAAMSASSITVIMNALRLRRMKIN